MEEYPNLVLIPDNSETLEDIIEDFTEMISYNLNKGVSVKEFLELFAEEVSYWSLKQYLITSARQTLSNLEEVCQFENDFLEDLDE